MRDAIQLKPAHFVGTSREDLRAFPQDVRYTFGRAIAAAQAGKKVAAAKPLKGYKGAGVLEVVEDCDGDTYRAVYTVRFAGIVYVLHVFQKKSTRGRRTAARDLDTIRERLKWAEEHYRQLLLARGRV